MTADLQAVAAKVLRAMTDIRTARLDNAAFEILIHPSDWDGGESTLWGSPVTTAEFVDPGHPQIVMTVTT